MWELNGNGPQKQPAYVVVIPEPEVQYGSCHTSTL